MALQRPADIGPAATFMSLSDVLTGVVPVSKVGARAWVSLIDDGRRSGRSDANGSSLG